MATQTPTVDVPQSFPAAMSDVEGLAAALAAKEATANKGAASGYAGLGADGYVVPAQLGAGNQLAGSRVAPASASASGTLAAADYVKLADIDLNNLLLGGASASAQASLAVLASKTIASASGAVWDGVKFAASTATITGATGITALSFTKIEAPTISGDTAGLVIGSAATLTITGPPVAGNANTTITIPLALHVLAGDSLFGNYTPLATATPLRVSFGATYGNSVAGSPNNLKWMLFDDGIAADRYGIGMSLFLMELHTAVSGEIGFFPNNGVDAGRFSKNANLLLGLTTDVATASSKLQVVASKTIASAAGAVWDGVKFAASTLTLTGGTQVTSSVNFFNIAAPTITDASAITVDTAATLYVAGPPAAAGSVTITAPYAVHVAAGNVRIDSLAGVGSRNVVVDANGVLSAP